MHGTVLSLSHRVSAELFLYESFCYDIIFNLIPFFLIAIFKLTRFDCQSPLLSATKLVGYPIGGSYYSEMGCSGLDIPLGTPVKGTNISQTVSRNKRCLRCKISWRKPSLSYNHLTTM